MYFVYTPIAGFFLRLLSHTKSPRQNFHKIEKRTAQVRARLKKLFPQGEIRKTARRNPAPVLRCCLFIKGEFAFLSVFAPPPETEYACAANACIS